MSTKFVCIDFETANTDIASACAVGAVVIENGVLIHRYYSLLKPHATCNSFSYFNTTIHGIRQKDVVNAPEFDEVYTELLPYMDGAVLVAHNAPFDVGVLRGVLRLYDIPHPDMPFLCTVKLSRRLWPELANHRLNTVCAYIEYQFKHHHAGEDAEGCANILMEGMRRWGSLSAEGLAKAGRFTLGQVCPKESAAVPYAKK